MWDFHSASFAVCILRNMTFIEQLSVIEFRNVLGMIENKQALNSIHTVLLYPSRP